MPQNGRGFCVGETRSGKSVLARYLIRDKSNLIIIDAKRDFKPPSNREFVIVGKPEDLSSTWRRNPQKVILYRPSIADLKIERINPVYEWIFERENTFVYNDELTTIILNAASYPNGLRAIYTQGGSRNVGVLSVTQRPSAIPHFIYTESERFWKFHLGSKQDQLRMAEYMGNTVVEPKDFPTHSAHHNKHSFFFYEKGQRTPAKEFVLVLGGNNGLRNPSKSIG